MSTTFQKIAGSQRLATLHNGGPIRVHLPAAKRLQLERIKAAVEARNKPRLALGRKPIVPP